MRRASVKSPQQAASHGKVGVAVPDGRQLRGPRDVSHVAVTLPFFLATGVNHGTLASADRHTPRSAGRRNVLKRGSLTLNPQTKPTNTRSDAAMMPQSCGCTCDPLSEEETKHSQPHGIISRDCPENAIKHLQCVGEANG